MKIRGHDRLINTFKRLAKEGKLSHGYIFFGEPQVGKRSFSVALATFLEKGIFENNKLLSETIILEPDEDFKIGIDDVRRLKNFLIQKPVESEYRVAIIDNADLLTPQAENAILKISEEPPARSLIVLIISRPEVLIPTLASRFQKIYFSRIEEKEITDFLTDEYGLNKKEAEKISKISFGRPGRAVDLIENEKIKKIRKDVLDVLKHKKNKKTVIENLIENNDEIPYFFTDLIAELSKDIEKNYETLKAVTKRMALINQFTTNKRLQLESAIWNI